MTCQLCLLKTGEHTVTAEGICGYCAQDLTTRLAKIDNLTARIYALERQLYESKQAIADQELRLTHQAKDQIEYLGRLTRLELEAQEDARDDPGEHFMDDDGRPQAHENEQHAAELAREPDCPF